MSSDQTRYYFSLQYSAIQKTVLRHDRLWSIAGISNILSRMNEIQMPTIAENCGGEVIVAGGGKFTARFTAKEAAEQAKKECIKLVATTLPMLEFQVSKVHSGPSFESLQNEKGRNLLITELGDQKRSFRGYAVSFNPHLLLCSECGEYPAQEEHWRADEDGKGPVCRVCKKANDESKALVRNEAVPLKTTLQQVYAAYFAAVNVNDPERYEPAADFNDLFPGVTDERKRMAVWLSDLNNMNDKVPVWLRQDDELKVLQTFRTFRQTVVDIIVDALAATFGAPQRRILPFRLVVAGGDDLCLVMAEKDVLQFALNLSRAVQKTMDTLAQDHPLRDEWLMKNGDFQEQKPKPFGFGASFVITSIHTPFSQIHTLGEDLMTDAKGKTERKGNSVGWRIMADENSVTEELLQFERPVFIQKIGRHDNGALSLEEYRELMGEYHNISSSHRQQIIAIMQNEPNPYFVEEKLKELDAGEKPKSFREILLDPRFRKGGDPQGKLLTKRIATLFELLSIGEKTEVSQ